MCVHVHSFMRQGHRLAMLLAGHARAVFESFGVGRKRGEGGGRGGALVERRDSSGGILYELMGAASLQHQRFEIRTRKPKLCQQERSQDWRSAT